MCERVERCTLRRRRSSATKHPLKNLLNLKHGTRPWSDYLPMDAVCAVLPCTSFFPFPLFYKKFLCKSCIHCETERTKLGFEIRTHLAGRRRLTQHRIAVTAKIERS